MKITIVSSHANLTADQTAKLKTLGDLQIVTGQAWDTEQTIKEIPETDILVADPTGIKYLNAGIFSGIKNLKFVSTVTVNTVWIDKEAAKKHQIPISTIKGANSESVAEHTWGMILDLAKRITEFNRDAILKGAFEFKNYEGVEVEGKTIGVIGLGDIGQKVARIAKAFDMKVVGLNKSGQSVEGIENVTLEELLKLSDVIVVCVPFNEETKDLISTQQVNQMKKGVILVNPATPEITNKNAVLEGLSSGKIFGFGIETDILVQIPKDDPYLTHPRIVATPHNAFNTKDAERKSFDSVIQNIEAFLAGKPRNLAW